MRVLLRKTKRVSSRCPPCHQPTCLQRAPPSPARYETRLEGDPWGLCLDVKAPTPRQLVGFLQHLDECSGGKPPPPSQRFCPCNLKPQPNILNPQPLILNPCLQARTCVTQAPQTRGLDPPSSDGVDSGDGVDSEVRNLDSRLNPSSNSPRELCNDAKPQFKPDPGSLLFRVNPGSSWSHQSGCLVKITTHRPLVKERRF